MNRTPRLAWKQIKSAGVVTVITFFIWFAADQNVLVTRSYDLVVRLASTSTKRYVSFDEPPVQRTIKVSMQGRRRRLQQFGEWVGSRPVITIFIDQSKSASEQVQTLSTTDDLLSRVKEIKESHLTVKSAQPESIEARIDECITLDEVRVQPEYGALKISAAKILPAVVSLRVPRFIANQLGQSPVALATAEQLIDAARAADGSFQVDVPLTLNTMKNGSLQSKVDFLPAKVKIQGQCEVQKNVTQSKGPIQITWSIPDEVQKKFIVVAEQADFRVNVDVTGSKNRVDQIDPADILGLVEVLAGDMDVPGPGKAISRKVKFFLVHPTDCLDCSLTSEIREIRFRLELRPGATAQPLNGE